MPLPFQTLAALQTAGSAIHAADVELQKSVHDLGDRVKAVMLDNPFDADTDSVFETWKTVARLSKAVAQIETEFKKIYIAASDLSSVSRSRIAALPILDAPVSPSTAGPTVIAPIQATDAVVKDSPKKRKSVTVKKKLKSHLSGNTAKVMERMLKVLNPTEFTRINRSAEALAIGLPKGSIGASITKLIQSKQLVADESGSLKLAPKKGG